MAVVNQDNGGGYSDGGDWWSSNLPNLPTGQFLPGDNPTGPVPPTPIPLTGGNVQEQFMALVKGKPATVQTLLSLRPQIEALGGRLISNADGSNYDVQFPGYTMPIDVLRGGSRGGTPDDSGWQWLDPTQGGGANGPIPTGDPRYPQDILTPWTKEFVPLSAEDFRNTPGYQAGSDAVKENVERSAAANGTLLTGGTLRRLAQRTSDYQDQQYGEAYNRSRDQYLLGRENFYNNQDRPFGKLSSLAQLGRPTGSG